MSLVDDLTRELKTVVPVVEMDLYRGEAEEYIVLTVTEEPDVYGDDDGQMISCMVLANWCYAWRPHIKETAAWRKKKADIKAAMRRAGCTSPTVTEAGDYEWGQLAFEANAMEAADEN